MKRRFALFTAIILFLVVSATYIVKVNGDVSEAPTSILTQSPATETYFQSSFSYATTALPLNTPMPPQEPSVYIPEKGTWQWVNVGPSSLSPYGGSQTLVVDHTDSSKICIKYTLEADGTRPLPADQETKLYNVPADEIVNWQGDYVNHKAAYYYLKFMLKSNFTVSNWNLMFQVCGDTSSYAATPLPVVDGLTPNNPQFQLTWTSDSLVLVLDDFYRNSLSDFSQTLISLSSVSKDVWHDLKVYYKMGSAFKAADGTIKVWIDDSLLFDAADMETCSYSGTPYMIWSIGNYGSRYEPYGTTIYFKDLKVTNAAPVPASTPPLTPLPTPTLTPTPTPVLTPSPSPTLVPNPISMLKSSPTPTLIPAPTVAPTLTPTVSPAPTGKPARPPISSLSPETFYVAAAIALLSIISIKLVALKKQKNSKKPSSSGYS